MSLNSWLTTEMESSGIKVSTDGPNLWTIQCIFSLLDILKKEDFSDSIKFRNGLLLRINVGLRPGGEKTLQSLQSLQSLAISRPDKSPYRAALEATTDASSFDLLK